MRNILKVGVLLAVWLMLGWAVAFSEENTDQPLSFTTHTQTVGAVTLALEPLDFITEINQDQTLKYTLKSTAEQPIRCALRFYSCDTVEPQGETTREVEIPASGEVAGTFTFQLKPGTYSAHYPLHGEGKFQQDGKELKIHSVRVLEARLKLELKDFPKAELKRGGVSLIGKSCMVSRQFEGEAEVDLGQNFLGVDPQTKADCMQTIAICNGDCRNGFYLHPPYRPKWGNLFLRFPVHLAEDVKHPTLSYACALRQPSPEEPDSDGVTFRIWMEDAKERGKDRRLLDEITTDSKTWIERTVELGDCAGKDVMLVLEVNPGPKNDTTCDGFYVSGLVLNTEEGKHLVPSLDPHFLSFRSELELANGAALLLYPGKNGLLDSRIDLVGTRHDLDGSTVSFRGIELSVGSISLRSPSTVYTQLPKTAWDELLIENETCPVTLFLYEENGLLILEVPEGNPKNIGGLRLREADVPFAGPELRKADTVIQRLYFGHGYVAEHPKGDIWISGGGHTLATSHVGCDFKNGTSVLMGASTLPNALIVSPKKHVCTLELNGVGKLALVPSTGGAFAAARTYRENCPWHSEPGAGTVRKRGRLVFDVWGGEFQSNLQQLQKAVAYGVTDALYVKHGWQRWGYDVRLPDIWDYDTPEVPTRNYEGLKALAEFCAEKKIPFGLHDNYIDFYPDAEGFSYDKITRQANGQPRKAWINHGAKAQSYQLMPSQIQPLLLRNLKLDHQYLPTMDAYFVDVLSSMAPFDFWSKDGEFQPREVTRKCWRDCFETIDRELAHKNADGETEAAITISEAGGDFLIGSLDGADAQWLCPVSDPKRAREWRISLPSDRCARTPWFAAVNHTNFSRHGAGYPDRFNALRDSRLHGVMSDDYICSEVLGGLDPMVSLASIFPGSVRKYFLTQGLARRLADKEIDSVEFGEMDSTTLERTLEQREFSSEEFTNTDICHPIVTWSDGTRVYANRGESAWTVQGVTLPRYGFLVLDEKDKPLAGIVTNPQNPNEIVEFAEQADGSFYMNGRGYATAEILPIQPVFQSAEVLPDSDRRKFRVTVAWKCDAPTEKELKIFAHVFEPRRGYGFVPDGWFEGFSSPIPTMQWGLKTDSMDTTTVVTGTEHVFTIPEGKRNGKYHVMVGLYDPANGKRFGLIGEDAQETRYSVASLQIWNGRVASRIEPVGLSEPLEAFQHLLANTTPISRHGISTLGALKVTPTDGGLDLLPLPFLSEFDVTLDESELGKRVVRVLQSDGTETKLERTGRLVTIRVTAGDEPKTWHVELAE